MADATKCEPGGAPAAPATIPTPRPTPSPPDESDYAHTMADSSNFAASPYPVYNLGGDDDSVQHAILTSHTGASIERNQDSGFAATRNQLTHRDVVGGTKDSRIETLQAKFDVGSQLKDFEVRSTERQARLEAKLDGMQIAQLTRELGETKADGRAAATNALLAQILAKLTPPAP